jgi:hypothetical protein
MSHAQSVILDLSACLRIQQRLSRESGTTNHPTISQITPHFGSLAGPILPVFQFLDRNIVLSEENT